jgi:hypothetical protein
MDERDMADIEIQGWSRDEEDYAPWPEEFDVSPCDECDSMECEFCNRETEQTIK